MGRIESGVLWASCLAAALLGTTAVEGAEPPKGKGVEAPPAAPSTGASQGLSGGEGQAATSVTSRSAGGPEEIGGMIDHAPGTRGKWWDLGASFEAHGLLWQNNTGAGSSSRPFLFGYAWAGLNFTRFDRLRVRAGFYQKTLSDQVESGARATDLSLSYSHLFRLPWELSLRATVAATAGYSFYSRLATLITAPTGSVSLSRAYKGLAVDLTLFGGGYIVQYSTGTNGANPNPKGIFGGSVEVDYSFWFHRPLVIGADVYTSYLWFYDVGSPPNMVNYGTTCPNGSTVPGCGTLAPGPQPAQQYYGAEIFIRYTLPRFAGIGVDLLIALAEGDPTLGYVSRNIDGTAHLFSNYYSAFEMYGAVTARF